MFLTQIQLRNWRSYRNASFALPTPDRSGRRNVVLIGAQNGVGKTSFLMALYLGMFGREALSLIEGFRSRDAVDDKFQSYRKLIESILHRPAREEDDPHSSVTLVFEVGEDRVSITRRWMFRQGGKPRDLDTKDGEEVLVEVNGRKKLFATWQEANSRVEELLFPCNVMPCLFFDGEQAQARVEAAGGRALFDAVKTLYGTGILDQLSESLRTYIGNERAALLRDVGSVRVDDLEQKRSELDRKRDELRTVQTELDETRKSKDEAEERRQRFEKQLYSMVGDKAADIGEYASAVDALQKDEVRLENALVSGLGALALPLALARQRYGLLAALEAEQVRERWLILKEEAAGKAAAIVDEVIPGNRPARVEPPLSESQSAQLRTSLEKALERLWSPPPQGCAPQFRFPFLQQVDRASAIAKIARIGSGQQGGVAEAALELHSIRLRLSETRIRFERTRDIQPQLQKLKSDLQEALDEHRALAGRLAGLEHKERGLQQEISDLRGSIGQMESRQDAVSPIQKKLDVAQRVRTLVDDAKDRLVPLCKAALEERCSLHFKAMISGEYSRFRARFDSDSEPWLEGPRGQQVLVSTLSGAQKRAFGLAFSLAVADVSQQEAPIVIDTPVGNMDSEYRGRVLQYVAEAAPGQVIFLSHDQEIYGPYAAMINSRIRKKFLVSFSSVEEGSGESSVSEDRYFEQ